MKRNQSGFTAIIIVIILAIIGIMGAYLLGKQQGITNPSLVSSTPTTSTLPDHSNDWATYTSNFGSLKYPSEVNLDKNGGLSFKIRDDEYNINILSSKTPGTSLYQLNPENINQVAMSLCPDWTDMKSCSDIKPGPMPDSIQVDLINRHYASTTTVIDSNGTAIYEVTLSTSTPNIPISNNAKELYNQIILTLKFNIIPNIDYP